jgi:histidinol phosphatase-like PHP family hydrolase
MSIVTDFERELIQKSPQAFGKWRTIDLHNHSPQSFDYQSGGGDYLERTAQRIIEADLDVVMFTDHNALPSEAFVTDLRSKTGKLILKGVELNVFVDAWNIPEKKIGKNLFFHLLIGFDPDSEQTPEYWLQHLYRECKTEIRDSGGTDIKGVLNSIQEICKILKGSNAILIPAHLHSSNDAFKSRSMDDIYSDPQFISAAKECFTALEVTEISTAIFFDGNHLETQNLHKTCIRSSDAHRPENLGTRPCFAQMENVTFSELKNALELPFRVRLEKPPEPSSFVIGLNIRGQYFPDLWLSLSPNCNVFMGVKGSGKTSVLECLRYVLGVEVPQSRVSDVHSHLSAILGTGGTIRALVKRADGAKIVIQRALNSGNFIVTFDDNRQETFTYPEVIQFPASILGWHEIEQAATDPKIRRVYLDAISGREEMRVYEEDVKSLSRQLHSTHDDAFTKFSECCAVQTQVVSLRQQRDGLQKLTDESLIELKTQYEYADAHRSQFYISLQNLQTAQLQIAERFSSLLPGLLPEQLNIHSQINEPIIRASDSLKNLFQNIEIAKVDFESHISSTLQVFQKSQYEVDTAFEKFTEKYRQARSQLTTEQQQLLDSHQRVMMQTSQLPILEVQLNTLKFEIKSLIEKLINQCDSAAMKIEQRTNHRRQRVKDFSEKLSEYGVQLALSDYTQSPFQNIANAYPEGWATFNELPPGTIFYRRMKQGYENILKNLQEDLKANYPSIFRSKQFAAFIDFFEDDDLIITFKSDGLDGASKPIDQLSAGQRCTAFFPILLKLQDGPLIIDQPEDNLDNRHIAKSIAPILIEDKRERQIVLTSHNANLVVLSDAEHIVSFEGQNNKGVILQRGFLSGQDSKITSHVVDVLDGGNQALSQRRLKYGASLDI